MLKHSANRHRQVRTMNEAADDTRRIKGEICRRVQSHRIGEMVIDTGMVKTPDTHPLILDGNFERHRRDQSLCPLSRRRYYFTLKIDDISGYVPTRTTQLISAENISSKIYIVVSKSNIPIPNESNKIEYSLKKLSS
jgi:hypothetical protein